MKKLQRVFYLLILIANVFTIETNAQALSAFPKGEVSTTNNHTGTVWLKELAVPDSVFSFSLAHASFAPSAKLDWHMHPAGQYLLITSGNGYYQEKGKAIRVVKEGDVIRCEPGVEHWHGAAPGSSFSYVGVTPTQKGKTVWFKRVTDTEYNSGPSIENNNKADQEIIALSKQKWQWMSDKNVDSLTLLFDSKAMFVHMGGTWGKDREIDIIKNGFIWYKKAEVYSSSARFFGNTAIVLNEIDLVAVVGGNEVINPFMVTEVYTKENGSWKMGQLTFSHLSRPVKLSK
jgi:4-carboxymuconolactone decarboxylase